jgi:hypothetical protein
MTDKFIPLLALVFTAALAFVGWQLAEASCVNYGEIVEKNHEADWTELRMTYNGDGTLASVVPIAHPERWTITIRGRGRKGELRRRVIDVPATQYGELRIGYWFDMREGHSAAVEATR